MPTGTRPAAPSLSVADAVIIIVGIVVGAGIFKTPSIVAAHAGSEKLLLLAWAAGGLISLIGALCYAELASAFPGRGGEYHYLRRAFGRGAGFLFAWSRMTVIQTGSIAMLAFLIGDYAAPTLAACRWSPAAVAALTIVLLTAVNLAGLRQGKRVQWLLVGALGCGFLAVLAVGAATLPAPETAGAAVGLLPGKAMIFVLLTFGGWNEAAYLSGEVREAHRNMARVLVISILLITALYLAVNLVLLNALGMAGMSTSQAVAADLMRLTFGEPGARLISVLVILAALSTMNATIITGARSIYALGRDVPLLAFVGDGQGRGETPTGALLLQGAVALLLVAVGAGARSGFEAMVEYTAPVFWLFFLLSGVSLFVLRFREPGARRPFRVPWYPALPFAFCATCLAMLVASLMFTGAGALAGAAVLLSGVPVLLVARWRRPGKPSEEENP